MAEHPSEAELQSLLQGVIVCHYKGIGKVILEGDCSILVESLQKTEKLSWKFMITWKKLTENLAKFEKWEIGFCRHG